MTGAEAVGAECYYSFFPVSMLYKISITMNFI